MSEIFHCHKCGSKHPDGPCPQRLGPPPVLIDTKAYSTRIVGEVMKEFLSHKRFWWWWDTMDEEVQNEVIFALMQKVESVLMRQNTPLQQPPTKDA